MIDIATLLAQVEGTGSAATLYDSENLDTIVTRIVVCNTSGAGTTFRVHHHVDSVAASTANALYYDHALPADETLVIEGAANGSGLSMRRNDRISVQGSGCTFTAYGSTLQASGPVGGPL